jgi:REP element-mobilizing transposase RayT
MGLKRSSHAVYYTVYHLVWCPKYRKNILGHDEIRGTSGTEFPRIEKRLWSGELWQDGYFARTVGDRMTRQIIDKYIKHHRDEEQGPAQLL